MSEIDVDSEDFSTPLQNMLVEAHEIHEELLAVGFSSAMVAQILAHMLSDAILNRNPISDEDEDEDDEDEDEYDEL